MAAALGACHEQLNSYGCTATAPNQSLCQALPYKIRASARGLLVTHPDPFAGCRPSRLLEKAGNFVWDVENRCVREPGSDCLANMVGLVLVGPPAQGSLLRPGIGVVDVGRLRPAHHRVHLTDQRFGALLTPGSDIECEVVCRPLVVDQRGLIGVLVAITLNVELRNAVENVDRHARFKLVQTFQGSGIEGCRVARPVITDGPRRRAPPSLKITPPVFRSTAARITNRKPRGPALVTTACRRSSRVQRFAPSTQQGRPDNARIDRAQPAVLEQARTMPPAG